MRKLFFMAALASVAFASCTKDENFYENEKQNANQEITFTPVAYKNGSRAIIDGPNYPTTETFSVYAWKGALTTGKNTQLYINKSKVSYVSNHNGSAAWVPEKTYYWPKKDKLDFFAFSPSTYAGTINVSNTEAITMTHTLNQSTNNEMDLMFTDKVIAKTSNDTQGNTITPNVQNGVALKFKHALSQLKFKVAMKDVGDGVSRTLTVKSITLEGLNSAGTLTLTAPEDWSISENWKTAEWATNTNDATYKYTGLNISSISTSPTAIVGDDESVNVAWLILPQDEVGKLTIVADIVTGTSTETDINYTATLASSEITKWEMGKIYTYTITLNPVSNNEILFVPSVEAWTDGTGTQDIDPAA